MPYRTDRNNNPAAITTQVAEQGGLLLNVDYELGDKFPPPSILITARLLHDPVELTIKVIDSIGYYTHSGMPRWSYIAIPRFIWKTHTPEQKRDIIGYHYYREGGTALQYLFPNYKGYILA